MRKYNSFIGNWLDLRINAAAQKFSILKKMPTLNEALQTANPGFGVLIGTDTNCYAAVYAFEARRRGLDVTAIPADTVKGTEVLSGFKEKSFKSFASKSSIEKQMAQYGDGARMEILVTWKSNPKMSHVFVAEQINDKTHFIDPQRNKTDCSWYFGDAKYILATRIDNALFSDNLKNFVLSAE